MSIKVKCYELVFFRYESLPHMVANETTGDSNWMLVLTSPPGPTALHPKDAVYTVWFKHLQVNTYSVCRVELSRLPEKENSPWHDGTRTCDSGSTVECFYLLKFWNAFWPQTNN